MAFSKSLFLGLFVAGATAIEPAQAQAVSPIVNGFWRNDPGSLTFIDQFQVTDSTLANPIYELFAGTDNRFFFTSPHASGSFHLSTDGPRLAIDQAHARAGLARWIALPNGQGFVELSEDSIRQFDAAGRATTALRLTELPNWPTGQRAQAWKSFTASNGALEIWLQISGGRQAFFEWKNNSLQLTGWFQAGRNTLVEEATFVESGAESSWRLRTLRSLSTDDRIGPLEPESQILSRDVQGFFSVRRRESTMPARTEARVDISSQLSLIADSRNQTVSIRRQAPEGNSFTNTPIVAGATPYSSTPVEILRLPGSETRFVVKTECELFVVALDTAGLAHVTGHAATARESTPFIGNPRGTPGACRELRHLVAYPGGVMTTDAFGGRVSFFRIH